MIAGALQWHTYLRIPDLGIRRNFQNRKVPPWVGSPKNNTFDSGGGSKVEEGIVGQRGEGCGNFVNISISCKQKTSGWLLE